MCMAAAARIGIAACVPVLAAAAIFLPEPSSVGFPWGNAERSNEDPGGAGRGSVSGGSGPDGLWPREVLRGLIWGAPGTVRVLYMGNSKVARPHGYAFDGIEDIARDLGRLAGNGFVIPLYSVRQGPEDTEYLLNTGNSMTRTNSTWRATDEASVLHAYNAPALHLVPGRTVKMANLGNGIAMLPRTEAVELTVQHLAGPGRGVYRVVPIEVLGEHLIMFRHPAAEVSCGASTQGAKFVRLTLPPMENPTLNRAFLLEGVAGDCTIYAVSAQVDAAGGVSVSEMGVSGAAYDVQAQEASCPPASWSAHVAAFGPHVVLWQYAGGQESGSVIDGTRELIDRIWGVNADAVHVLLIDTPTPRSNSAVVIGRSLEWAYAVAGHRGAIVIDPRPYLPPDMAALGGTGQLGAYFADDVHENRFGARTVGEAVWEALRDYAEGVSPPAPCRADCDRSSGARVLDIFDFLCFQGRYAAGEPYACDFDLSSGAGVCDVFDFLRFQNAFAEGCP